MTLVSRSWKSARSPEPWKIQSSWKVAKKWLSGSLAMWLKSNPTSDFLSWRSHSWATLRIKKSLLGLLFSRFGKDPESHFSFELLWIFRFRGGGQLVCKILTFSQKGKWPDPTNYVANFPKLVCCGHAQWEMFWQARIENKWTQSGQFSTHNSSPN